MINLCKNVFFWRWFFIRKTSKHKYYLKIFKKKKEILVAKIIKTAGIPKAKGKQVSCSKHG